MTNAKKNNAPLKPKTTKVQKEKKPEFNVDYTKDASSENPHFEVNNVLKVLSEISNPPRSVAVKCRL